MHVNKKPNHFTKYARIACPTGKVLRSSPAVYESRSAAQNDRKRHSASEPYLMALRDFLWVKIGVIAELKCLFQGHKLRNARCNILA